MKLADDQLKQVEEIQILSKNQGQIFDNPLNEDFLHLDAIANFFRKSKKWVLMKVTQGLLRCYPVAKGILLFYVPEVREAILAGLLAPDSRRNDNDKKTKNQKWEVEIPGPDFGQWRPSLSDLRHVKAGSRMGKRD